MALVEVRPLEKERWHNKSGREGFARPITIEAPVSLITGKLVTGLSEEDQVRLEKETKYDLSSEYTPGKPHPFYHSMTGMVKLENKTNIFNSSKPIDEIKIKIMKAHDLVANSQKEYEEGKYPDALFVIFDELEEVTIKASKAAVKRKVILEASKLTKTRKAEIVQILSGISVRNQSEDYVDLKLDDAIEASGAERVLTLIQRDKTRTALHALVLEGIHKQVLRKDGTAVYYMDDQIGFDVESAVDYFSDPKNQTMKAQIMDLIN